MKLKWCFHQGCQTLAEVLSDCIHMGIWFENENCEAKDLPKVSNWDLQPGVHTVSTCWPSRMKEQQMPKELACWPIEQGDGSLDHSPGAGVSLSEMEAYFHKLICIFIICLSWYLIAMCHLLSLWSHSTILQQCTINRPLLFCDFYSRTMHLTQKCIWTGWLTV